MQDLLLVEIASELLDQTKEKRPFLACAGGGRRPRFAIHTLPVTLVRRAVSEIKSGAVFTVIK